LVLRREILLAHPKFEFLESAVLHPVSLPNLTIFGVGFGNEDCRVGGVLIEVVISVRALLVGTRMPKSVRAGEMVEGMR
jgi:hypothetical protein